MIGRSWGWEHGQCIASIYLSSLSLFLIDWLVICCRLWCIVYIVRFETNIKLKVQILNFSIGQKTFDDVCLVLLERMWSFMWLNTSDDFFCCSLLARKLSVKWQQLKQFQIQLSGHLCPSCVFLSLPMDGVQSNNTELPFNVQLHPSRHTFEWHGETLYSWTTRGSG